MESNDATSSSVRAQELRASLGTRREVEALLAEASATREAAVADADAIIEEAQQVSEQLLRESRGEAERTSSEARLRAEGLVSRARTEAEDITRQARAAADAVRARAEAQVEEHRRRVRAELTEQVTREVAEQSRRELARVQERQQSMIGDIEASVRILGVSMEAAVANIGEMLGALDSLRTHTVESLGDASIPLQSSPAPVADEEPGFADLVEVVTVAEALERPEDLGATRGPERADLVADDEDYDDELDDDPDGQDHTVDRNGPDVDLTRARTARSGHLIDALADLDSVVDGGDRDSGQARINDGEDAPMTATEAFLRSAHLEHDDPPLPPMDDAEVGTRYAREAMEPQARARGRRDEETLEVLPERGSVHRPGRNGRSGPDERVAEDEDGEASGKPLGWLFRSS